MTNRPLTPPNERATIRLPELRETLRQAITQYGSDPALRRALMHAEKAVEKRATMGTTTKDR